MNCGRETRAMAVQIVILYQRIKYCRLISSYCLCRGGYIFACVFLNVSRTTHNVVDEFRYNFLVSQIVMQIREFGFIIVPLEEILQSI